MSYAILFLCALSPGQVLRYFERNFRHSLAGNRLLLSDASGSASIRCLTVEEPAVEPALVFDWISSLGPTLSKAFPPRVTLLRRQSATSTEPAKWGFTVWEEGVVTETAEHSLLPEARPNLMSRLPGMKRNAPRSPDIEWALARGLPIDRVPATGLRRHMPIIDYVTVAQLDQRSLLVENSPRLYRFPLGNS
ncbi:MAG: hypothetical protein V4671_14785 [Armatimonadota bacterium]